MLGFLLWLASLGTTRPRVAWLLAGGGALAGLWVTGRVYETFVKEPLSLVYTCLAVYAAGATAAVATRMRPATALYMGAFWAYAAASYQAARQNGWQLYGTPFPFLVAWALAWIAARHTPERSLRPYLLALGSLAAAQAALTPAPAGIPPPVPDLDPLDRWLPDSSLLQFGSMTVALGALAPPTTASPPSVALTLLAASALTADPLTWMPALAAAWWAGRKRAVLSIAAVAGALSLSTWNYALQARAWPGTELERQARLALIPPATGLTALQLGTLLPPRLVAGRRIRYPSVSPLPVTQVPADRPDWLIVSNNPELVQNLARTQVLYRGRAPAGAGRFFVSHLNVSEGWADLHLSLRNPSDGAVELAWTREATLVGGDMTRASRTRDFGGLGTELWLRYLSPAEYRHEVLNPGTSTRLKLEGLKFGENGMMMLELECGGPLEVAVAMVKSGQEPDLTGPVTGMVFRQSRGIYSKPDREMTGTFSLGEGVLRAFSLGEVALDGRDGDRVDSLKGNYGAVSELTIRLEADPARRYRRAAILLVARGGYVGAVVDGRKSAADSFGAIVLFNRPVEQDTDWTYRYTLPCNSFAPVAVLLVPLPR
ncbi:MAG: hypothetical protein AB1758_24165 [Candidatus Eremiobacterota bacterium]